jgi:hypothetical protein
MQEKLECIANNCVLGMCLSSEPCTQSLLCMSACNSGECAQNCAEAGPGGGPIKNILDNAAQCAVDFGCLEYQSDDPEDCDFVYCGDEIAECFLDPGCIEQIECSDECDESDDADECQEDCYAGGMNPALQSLYFCSVANECND